MQIIFTFNPTSVLSWLKKRYFDKKVKRQVMLHGKIPFTDCIPYQAFNGSLDTDVLIIHSTYRDNNFLTEDDAKEMERLKEDDVDEYNIYGKGWWGIFGSSYFSKHNVNAQIAKNIQPVKTGYFEFKYVNHEIIKDTIKWIDDEDGYIKIYEEVREGYPYVLSGDTAGEGSDWNTCCVTDNTTRGDVATVRINFDEDLYARQVYCLGLYYNEGLIGIETNFSTHPNKELERLGYPFLYVREQSPDAYTNKLMKKFGFLTTKLTRPQALGMLRTLMREEPELVVDRDTLNEMTTFVKNEKGKPTAVLGANDDMVIARAINCYIAEQQRAYPSIKKSEPTSVIYNHKRSLLKKKKRRRVL